MCKFIANPIGWNWACGGYAYFRLGRDIQAFITAEEFPTHYDRPAVYLAVVGDLTLPAMTCRSEISSKADAGSRNETIYLSSGHQASQTVISGSESKGLRTPPPPTFSTWV